jgi:hypothetical protein
MLMPERVQLLLCPRNGMRGYLVTVTTYEPYPRIVELTFKVSGAHVAASRAIAYARKQSPHVRRITAYSVKIQPL